MSAQVRILNAWFKSDASRYRAKVDTIVIPENIYKDLLEEFRGMQRVPGMGRDDNKLYFGLPGLDGYVEVVFAVNFEGIGFFTKCEIEEGK